MKPSDEHIMKVHKYIRGFTKFSTYQGGVKFTVSGVFVLFEDFKFKISEG